MKEHKWSYHHYSRHLSLPVVEDIVKNLKGWQEAWFSSPVLMNIPLQKDVEELQLLYKQYKTNLIYLGPQVGLTIEDLEKFKKLANDFFTLSENLARSNKFHGFVIAKILN